MGQDTGGNVDLIFLGVEYLEAPVLLRGVKIEKSRDEPALRLENRFFPGNLDDPGERVYTIYSEDQRYNIIARNFWVLICKESNKESSLISLFNKDTKLRDVFFDNNVLE